MSRLIQCYMFTLLMVQLVHPFSGAVQHNPGVKINSVLIGHTDFIKQPLLAPEFKSGKVSVLRSVDVPEDVDSLNENDAELLVKEINGEDYEKQLEEEVPVSKKEKPTLEEHCSELSEPSDKPTKGLFTKDLDNEMAVSEPPYGWVYPPEAEEVHRLKTIHLFLPDALPPVGAGDGSQSKRSFLHQILGDALSFYMLPRAYIIEGSSNALPEFLKVSSVDQDQTHDVKKRNNLRETKKNMSWLETLKNPFSRAFQSVEDWWNGNETSTTNSPQPSTTMPNNGYVPPYTPPVSPPVPPSPYISPMSPQQPPPPMGDKSGYSPQSGGTVTPPQPYSQPPPPYNPPMNAGPPNPTI